MNWKDEVADKLRRYPVMASAANSIPMELKCLEQEACSIQSAQGGRTGVRSIRAYEDRLMNIMVKQQELESLLVSTESWLKVMDTALERLTKGEQRLLDLMYIQQTPAVQICKDLGLERSSLYRHRDMALKNLTLVMYGVLES